MTRTLVVAPQAGLGNRLRALASAMVLAKQTGRQIRHAWHTAVANDPRPHVAALQQHGIEEFFAPTDALPYFDPTQAIDATFSEWLPNEYWYPWQSNVQRELGVRTIFKSLNAADPIALSSANTILLETSHRVRLSPDLGGCHHGEQFRAELHAAYRLLTPQAGYLARLEDAPEVDVGIAIRRGDLLHYASVANQSLEAIRTWVLAIARERRVAVFSDDPLARKFILDSIPGYREDAAFEAAIYDQPAHRSAFTQMLYLAHRCGEVYGTPGSSFALEAALFGGRNFNEIPGSAVETPR